MASRYSLRSVERVTMSKIVVSNIASNFNLYYIISFVDITGEFDVFSFYAAKMLHRNAYRNAWEEKML